MNEAEPIPMLIERRPAVDGELLITADGRWAVVGAPGITTTVWDVERAESAFELGEAAEWGPAVLRRGERWLVTGAERRFLKLKDLQTGESAAGPALELRPHLAAFSPDGVRIAAVGIGYGDDPLAMGNLETMRVELEPPLGSSPTAIALADTGRLAAGFGMGKVVVWDPTAREVRCHAEAVTAMAMTADGRRFVTGSSNGTMKLWDAGSLEMLQRFERQSSGVRAVTISADGEIVVSGSDSFVRMWRNGERQALAELRCRGLVTICAQTPDGRAMVVGVGNRKVYFVSVTGVRRAE